MFACLYTSTAIPTGNHNNCVNSRHEGKHSEVLSEQKKLLNLVTAKDIFCLLDDDSKNLTHFNRTGC